MDAILLSDRLFRLSLEHISEAVAWLSEEVGKWPKMDLVARGHHDVIVLSHMVGWSMVLTAEPEPFYLSSFVSHTPSSFPVDLKDPNSSRTTCARTSWNPPSQPWCQLPAFSRQRWPGSVLLWFLLSFWKLPSTDIFRALPRSSELGLGPCPPTDRASHSDGHCHGEGHPRGWDWKGFVLLQRTGGSAY